MANLNSLNRMIAAVNKGLVRPSDLPLLRQRAQRTIERPRANGSNPNELIAAAGQLTDAIITRQLLFKSSVVVSLPGQRTPILLKKESVTYFTGTNQPNVGELAEPVSIYGAQFTEGTLITFDREGKPTHTRETSGIETPIINNKKEIVPNEAQVALDATRSSLLSLLNARPTGAPAAEQEVASLREQLTKANRELQAAKRQNAILDAALAKPAYTVTEMIEEIKAQLAKLQEQWQTIDAAINTAEEAKAQLTVKLSGEEEASLMLNTRFSQQLSELEDRIAQTKSEHEQKLAADPMISACLRESVELTQLWAQTIDPRQKNLLQTKIEGKTNLLSKLRGGADRQLKADLSRLENEKTRLARESNTNQRHYASTIAGFNSQLAAREKEIAKKTEERARIGQELNQAISSLSSLINGINAALSATWQAPERDPE